MSAAARFFHSHWYICALLHLGWGSASDIQTSHSGDPWSMKWTQCRLCHLQKESPAKHMPAQGWLFSFLWLSAELSHVRVNLVYPRCSLCSWLQVLFALEPWPISSINSKSIFDSNDPLHLGHHSFCRVRILFLKREESVTLLCVLLDSFCLICTWAI